MPSYHSLKSFAKGIAIIGGVGTFALMNSIPWLYNKKIRNSDHYKQALELLRNHPEAVKYLGEPIIEKPIQVTDPQEFGNDGEFTFINVPLKGSLTDGKLFYNFLIKKDENEPTKISRVELTLDSHKGYKLLIKKPE